MQFAIDDVAAGDAIVGELLTNRLVACAQTIGPVTSRYWWGGSINHAQEWLFLCKTTPERSRTRAPGSGLGDPDHAGWMTC